MAKLPLHGRVLGVGARRVSEREYAMKKIIAAVLGAVGLASIASTPALAIEGLSANATVTTNYLFRGITQSADNPAVQGGLDYAFGDSGFAVGTWASSVNFRDDPNGNNTTFELDLYANYAGSIGNFGYTAGVIGYLYPSQSSYVDPKWDFVEFNAGASYNFGVATVSGKVFYSPDNIGSSTWYWTGGIAVPLGSIFSITGNVGYWDWQDTGYDAFDALDWNIGIAATYEIYTLALMYADTDLEDTDGKFIVSITIKTM